MKEIPVTTRIITFLITVALGASACDGIGISGNGQRSTETRALTGFARVDSRDSLEVLIEQGPAFAVTVSIDSNLIGHVDTHVTGETLVIEADLNIRDTVAGPHVRVTLPRADALMVRGSGDLRVPALTQDTPIALVLSGSGRLEWQGAVPLIDAAVNGSGGLRLAGSTDRLVVGVNGSGDVAASQLEAATGSVEVNGSGSVSVTIRQSAEVAIRGSGDVDLFGGAKLSRVVQSGSGDLRLHP
jgi:hypothetical protein